MTGRMMPPQRDRIEPGPAASVAIVIDGETMTGIAGQSIAGVLLAAGRLAWRTTAVERRPRGVFCGIGVCFDCLVTVNGVRDVRACQRAAHDGDVVSVQREELPHALPAPEADES